ncbi:MAG: hypothetical protein V1911_02525, partial [Candidatus Micrarchaeota archaeon]
MLERKLDRLSKGAYSIRPNNVKLINAYVAFYKAGGIEGHVTLARTKGVLDHMVSIAQLANFDFDRATRREIERLLIKINESKAAPFGRELKDG